jgi:hypothetical protein
VSVYCDVTVALPLLVSALETTARKTLARRKRPTFDVSGQPLSINGRELQQNRFQEPG